MCRHIIHLFSKSMGESIRFQYLYTFHDIFWQWCGVSQLSPYLSYAINYNVISEMSSFLWLPMQALGVRTKKTCNHKWNYWRRSNEMSKMAVRIELINVVQYLNTYLLRHSKHVKSGVTLNVISSIGVVLSDLFE